MQAVALVLGLREERMEGCDSFKCRLSAGPPALMGPLYPLSARVPNSGGSLECCGVSPSLLPGFPHCWARFQLSLIC